MANRIVIVGPKGTNGNIVCMEVPSALDADALISSGVVRATVSKYGGPLADATILTWPQKRIIELSKVLGDVRAAAAWWEDVLSAARIMHPKPQVFVVDVRELGVDPPALVTQKG